MDKKKSGPDSYSEVNEAVQKYKRDRDKKFTYADYESWDDENRYELIDGVEFMMSAPSTAHQSILIELSRQIANFLKGKSCRVFTSPYDVCLNGLGDDDYTVVQPDILVVCDKSKIDEKRCNGAPDMVIEILSPSTSKRDLLIKQVKYQEAGVREYWIVDPDYKMVKVYAQNNGYCMVKVYRCDESIAMTVLEGCTIALPDVFSDIA